jgi:hypothetical protein
METRGKVRMPQPDNKQGGSGICSKEKRTSRHTCHRNIFSRRSVAYAKEKVPEKGGWLCDDKVMAWQRNPVIV